MNDHLNDNNPSGDGLCPEELALLKEALDTAWPPPKKSIRDGVMAQVKRERMLEKRRVLRDRILRYGSLAACLVLITAAGFKILPAMTQKSADMAVLNNAEAVYTCATADMAAETVPETAAAAAQSSEEEGYTDNDSAENPGTDNTPKKLMAFAAPPAAAGAESAPAEAAPECEAEEVMDAVCEEEAIVTETCCETAADDRIMLKSPGPAASPCVHAGVFADSYHTVPDVIIACTGEDIYLAWLDTAEGCDRSIADFLYYMEENSSVLLSDIEMIYDATDLWYRYDWDFDLLESRDTSALEEYYGNGGNFSEMVKRDTDYRFKLALLDETGAEMNVDVCAWSIADLVESENITISALTEIYEKSAGGIESDYPGYTPRLYDLTALHEYAFSAANDEPTPPGAIAAGRHEDEMFHLDTENLK